MHDHEDAELVADGVMSVNAAMQFADLSRASLYREFASGRIPFVKYGSRTLIPRRGLIAFLAQRVVRTTEQPNP